MDKVNLSHVGTNLNCLSENHILNLQRVFLEPGFHSLYVNNFENSRAMINDIVKSLNYYKKPGYLSTENFLLNNFFNIYDWLLKDKYFENNQLIEFFYNNFDFDFLWIELGDELFNSLLYKNFREIMTDLKLENSIPIIITILER